MKKSLGRFALRAVWIGLALLVSGCTGGALSIAAKASLYERQNWSARVEVVYAQLEHQYAGAQIEQMISGKLSQMQARGIRARCQKRVERGGNVRYTLTASGQGYPLLNAAFFDGQAIIQMDESQKPPQITFSYAPYGTFFGAALSRTFTLKGSKILASNGLQATRGSVTWSNPMDVMQATLTPTPRLGLGSLLLALAVVGSLVLVVVVLSQAKRQRCPNCGTHLPRQADFCTKCGAVLGY